MSKSGHSRLKAFLHASWYWLALLITFLCLLGLSLFYRNQFTSTPNFIVFAIALFGAVISILQSILSAQQTALSEQQTEIQKKADTAQQIERTTDLLRLFVEIISTPPNYEPYIDCTSKDFDMLQVLEDEVTIQKAEDKDIVKFLNQLEVFASLLNLYSNIVELNYLTYTLNTWNTFIKYVNDFFDVVCFFRYSESPTLYPNIVEVYGKLEGFVVSESLIHAENMKENGYNTKVLRYDVYYNENDGMPLFWGKNAYIPIVVRSPNGKGICGWPLELSYEKLTTSAKVTVEAYVPENKESEERRAVRDDGPKLLSDVFASFVTNSSGTIFICYSFLGNTPIKDSEDIISIIPRTEAGEEPLISKLRISIKAQNASEDNDGTMFIEDASEDNDLIVFCPGNETASED